MPRKETRIFTSKRYPQREDGIFLMDLGRDLRDVDYIKIDHVRLTNSLGLFTNQNNKLKVIDRNGNINNIEIGTVGYRFKPIDFQDRPYTLINSDILYIDFNTDTGFFNIYTDSSEKTFSIDFTSNMKTEIATMLGFSTKTLYEGSYEYSSEYIPEHSTGSLSLNINNIDDEDPMTRITDPNRMIKYLDFPVNANYGDYITFDTRGIQEQEFLKKKFIDTNIRTMLFSFTDEYNNVVKFKSHVNMIFSIYYK